MRKKSAAILMVGMVLALTALAACGSGDDDAAESGASATELVQSEGVSGPPDGPPEGPPAFFSDPDLSEADIEYLVAVGNANESRDKIFERFGEIFERTWPLRSQLISALVERQVEVDAGARDSIIAADVAGFALANGELGRIAPTFGPLLPRHLCEATAGNAESTAHICAPPDDLPGGDYGAGLDALLRQNQAEVAAVGGTMAFPLSLSDDELAEIFSQVFPAAIAVLAQQTSDLASLNPPSEYDSDNAVMETFFSEMSAFFDGLAESAEAGDIDAVRFGFFDTDAIVCDALDGLGSGDVLEIVAVHLGPQAECGDDPFSEPVDTN